MATATRIYFVAVEGVPYLVRAAHPSAAMMHVARNVATVRVASQDDLVANLSAGVKVETAGDESEPEPAPAEEKSLPLWPMPWQAAAALPDETDDQAEDDQPADGYYSQPDHRAAGVPPRQRVPAKYRCPQTGSTWSGRGLKPQWLRVAMEGGRPLSDFLVIEPSTADA